MLVSVCVATYQRPDGLRSLLESIDQQELPENVAVEVIVVDNDPPSAESVVEQLAASSRFPLTYLSQPEPNISLTRNVAVEAAQGDAVWFVDDDEVAEPDCLALLIGALEEFGADGVFGPVRASFDAELPDWAHAIYNRPVHPTGTPSNAHRTGNTLVRSSALAMVPGPFDPEYGLSGGSDSMLFRQLERNGLTFINSADAFVTESVPAARASWHWLKARALRQGQNYGRQTVTLHGGRYTGGVALMAVKALVHIAVGTVSAVASWRDRSRRAPHLLHVWSNIGKLQGAMGTVSLRGA